MSKIIILYFAREWTLWFLGCLFFLLGTTFLFSVVEDAQDIFSSGFVNWYHHLWNWMLGLIPWLLPISSLGASLFSLSFIRKRGEWTAILANGISPIKSFSLVAILGIMIALLGDWLMTQRTGNALHATSLPTRSLKMQVGLERLWYFRSFDPVLNEGKELQLFCYGQKGENILRVYADRAVWSPSSGWTFHDGRLLGFYSDRGLPNLNPAGVGIYWEKSDASKHAAQVIYSTSPGINRGFEKLTNFEFSDDPQPYVWLQKRPKEMSANEIDCLLEGFANSESERLIPYLIRKAQLWWNGPACVVALVIGLSLAGTKSSSSPAKLAGLALIGSLAFFLLHRMSYALGIEGIISPFWSASLPFFLIIGFTFAFLRMQK